MDTLRRAAPPSCSRFLGGGGDPVCSAAAQPGPAAEGSGAGRGRAGPARPHLPPCLVRCGPGRGGARGPAGAVAVAALPVPAAAPARRAGRGDGGERQKRRGRAFPSPTSTSRSRGTVPVLAGCSEAPGLLSPGTPAGSGRRWDTCDLREERAVGMRKAVLLPVRRQ